MLSKHRLSIAKHIQASAIFSERLTVANLSRILNKPEQTGYYEKPVLRHGIQTAD
jgi:hypothetical protein